MDAHELWTQLCESPDDAGLRDEVRSKLDAVLEHVERCDSCRAHPVDASELFEVLGLDEHGHVYDADAHRQWHATLADQDAQIRLAMRDVLRERLSPVARSRYDALIPARLDELAMFRAADTCALTIRGFPRRGQSPALRMLDDGTLTADGKPAVPARSFVGEIQRTVELDRPLAEEVVGWLPHALRTVPYFLSGIEAMLDGEAGIALGIEPRDNAEALAERWQRRPRRAPVVLAEIQRLSAELAGLHGRERDLAALAIAKLHRRAGNADAAAAVLEDVSPDPSEVKLNQEIFQIYVAADRVESAVELCNHQARLAKDEKLVAKYRVLQGKAFEIKKDQAAATLAYEAAVRLDPADPVGLNCLGRAYFTQGRLEDARAIYNNAIVTLEDQPVPEAAEVRVADVYYAAGTIEFKLGQVDSARKLISRAQKLEPDNPAFVSVLELLK